MPTWDSLLSQLNTLQTPDQKQQFLNSTLNNALDKIAKRRGSNTLIYASSFLQKPMIPPFLTQISPEDINGFKASISGLDFNKPLTLILHTPGGVMAATETIVEYLRSKFSYMEVIVPVYAMSGGTMMALAANKIVMGRQSQLGPIDAQLATQQGISMSASSILAQFEKAKEEIAKDKATAAVWAPVLSTIGPSLIQQAQNSLECGGQMVERWLASSLLSGKDDAETQAATIAGYFNSEDVHLSHGRRISAQEAVDVGLDIEILEDDQDFQDEVLTAYHMATLVFEQTPVAKLMRNDQGRGWIKNSPVPAPQPTP